MTRKAKVSWIVLIVVSVGLILLEMNIGPYISDDGYYVEGGDPQIFMDIMSGTAWACLVYTVWSAIEWLGSSAAFKPAGPDATLLLKRIDELEAKYESGKRITDGPDRQADR